MARFAAQAPTGTLVQQLEFLVRTAIFKSANAVVGFLLQQAVDQIDAAYQARPGWVRKGRSKLLVQGLFGYSELSRDYYYHAGKQQGHYPADAALGLETGYTPALTRLLCLEGADETSYQKAETHLQETAGIAISARQIQRVAQRVGVAAQQWQERDVEPAECASQPVPILYVSADGTGVPMRKEVLAGRPGKGPTGEAKTLQGYLGCVFTQHGVDDAGHPVRDWESTTYVSGLTGIHEFGPCLRHEALRRGLGGAQQVVLLIDGAEGLEHMGWDCFSGCVQIVDYYHALEHWGRVLGLLGGDNNHPDYRRRLRHGAKRLLKDGVEKLIAQARAECAGKPHAAAVQKELGYFVRNVDRMQYGTFRAQGFFIGSGVIEAGCKTVIGARCKQSGMFWGIAGAEHILALRCIHASRRLDAFWKFRLNQHAARNDALPLAA